MVFLVDALMKMDIWLEPVTGQNSGHYWRAINFQLTAMVSSVSMTLLRINLIFNPQEQINIA